MINRRRHQDPQRDYVHPNDQSYQQSSFNWLTSSLSWLFRQETGIVICVLVVGIATYFANYTIKTTIPQILDRQEHQLDRIVQAHEREVKDIVTALEETRAYDRQIFLEILREIQGTRDKIEQAVEAK